MDGPKSPRRGSRLDFLQNVKRFSMACKARKDRHGLARRCFAYDGGSRDLCQRGGGRRGGGVVYGVGFSFGGKPGVSYHRDLRAFGEINKSFVSCAGCREP